MCASRIDAISLHLTCPSAIAAPELHSDREFRRYGMRLCNLPDTANASRKARADGRKRLIL